MPKLIVLVASTRPGRIGSTIGKWTADTATAYGKFEVEFVELADMNLPLFDEPEHPAKQSYTHAHTKAWSEKVASADAFIFVTPEYNFATPPSLLNALTFLVREWAYKPVAFVSYGGLSGGMRSVQMTKQILTTLKMVPLMETVVLPNVFGHLNDEGTFVPEDIHNNAAKPMLDELLRWTNALAQLRA